MLKTVDPLLTPELLFVLASMGHGDELVLCDENFPAASTARSTTYGTPIRLAGIGVPAAARAILSVLPLDGDVETPVLRMEVTGAAEEIPDVQQDLFDELTASRNGGSPASVGSLERFTFYEAARRAYAVVWTGERRFYGCFIFKKGVLPPPAEIALATDAHALPR
jgi:L-fucose mutarotase